MLMFTKEILMENFIFFLSTMRNILYKDVLRLMEFVTEFTYLWGVKRVVLGLFEKLNCIICEDNLVDCKKASEPLLILSNIVLWVK